MCSLAIKKKTIVASLKLADGLKGHLVVEEVQSEVRRKSQIYPLATVNDDVFRSDASLQHAHLWMIASSSEEPGRLDAEVPDPLLVVVHDAEPILLEDSLVLLLDFLQQRIKG